MDPYARIMTKKSVTLGDVLAHVQALGSRLATIESQFDAQDKKLVVLERIEQRLDRMDQHLERIDQRLTRTEIILCPSVKRLQITMVDHGTRIRRLESRERFLEEEVESVVG